VSTITIRNPPSAADWARTAENVQHLENFANDPAPAVLTAPGGGTRNNLARWDSIIRTRYGVLNSRGAWVTGTAYAVNDLYSSGGNTYIVLTAHTSAASVATDLAAGRVGIYRGVTAADLAGSLAAAGIGVLGGFSGAVARTLQDRFRDQVFAADCGILPNGVDHSARMQSLIDEMSAAGGGVIQLTPSASAYVMRFTLKTGVCVRGVPGAYGQNFTGSRRLVEILMPTTPGDIISYAAPTGADPEGNTNQNTGLVGLVIRGRGAGTAGRGISVQAARNAIIHDVAIYDTADEPFHVANNVRLGNFTQMGGYNCLLNRTRVANTYAARLGGGDHIIADWEFNPALTALSSENKFIRAIGILGDNVRWDNIIGEFADVGITIEGELHHGGRSRGEFNFAEGYDIGSIGARLGTLYSGVNSMGSDGVYDGIVLRGTSASNQITEWSNHNDGRGNTRYGLRDDQAGDNDKNYLGQGFSSGDRTAPVLIASNGGGLVQQNADFFIVSGNSATPRLLPWIKNFRISNSSATTVTEFLNTFPGMEVCVYADNSNTTLQHNGTTFILPNSRNLNLVAGQMYVLKRLGGAFFLVSGEGASGYSNLTDASQTIPLSFGRQLVHGVPIAAPRTLTLPTSGLQIGEIWAYTRLASATGSSAVTIEGRAVAAGQWVELSWTGSAWVVVRSGSL
jgi:hypothetical protein